jgi:hypothetical protein
VFGWLSVNYLLNNVYTNGGVSNITVGALDLGGASAQITYQVCVISVQ